MGDIAEIVGRLEKLEKPDGHLDCLILAAVEGWKNIGGGWREWPDGLRERYEFGFAPPYTKSIDAALTLVPSHLHLLNLRHMNDTKWHAGLAARFAESEFDNDFEADAKTPAIALCIAALRAREKQ